MTMVNKDDLRVIKTCRDLSATMRALLTRRKFINITVNALCEEALVSRATFYVHFRDKYDMLKYLLNGLVDSVPGDLSAFGAADITEAVNSYVCAHKDEIKNIVAGADEITLELLLDFIETLIRKVFGRGAGEPADTVLLRFCAGGMMNLLKWQMKNGFPAGSALLSDELCAALERVVGGGCM